MQQIQINNMLCFDISEAPTLLRTTVKHNKIEHLTIPTVVLLHDPRRLSKRLQMRLHYTFIKT